jgi:amino acid transporter
MGIPIFIFMFVGYKVFYKTEFRRPSIMDLFTGKQEVDDEENEWLEKARVKQESEPGRHNWYKFIGWIF